MKINWSKIQCLFTVHGIFHVKRCQHNCCEKGHACLELFLKNVGSMLLEKQKRLWFFSGISILRWPFNNATVLTGKLSKVIIFGFFTLPFLNFFCVLIKKELWDSFFHRLRIPRENWNAPNKQAQVGHTSCTTLFRYWQRWTENFTFWEAGTLAKRGNLS